MVWLILALAVLPLLHFSGFKPIQTAHVFGLIVLGVGIAGAKVFQKNKSLGVGVFCVLASYLIAFRTPLVREAFNILLFFLIWLQFYFAATKSKVRPLLWAIAIAGTLNAFYLGCQTLGFDFVFNHLNQVPRYPVYGFLGSSGNSGVFQAVCLPAAIHVHPLLGLCVFAGLLLAHSTTSIIAGMIGASVYLLFRYPKLIKFLLFIPVILILLIIFVDKPGKADFDVRFANVYYTVKYIRKGEMTAYKIAPSPKGLMYSTYKLNYTPFGYGLGSFQVTMPFIPAKDVKYNFNMRDAKIRHPHNDYVFVLYEMGLGALVMVWILLAAIKKATPVIKGSLVACAVGSLGYFLLLIPTVTIMIAVLLGINDGGEK